MLAQALPDPSAILHLAATGAIVLGLFVAAYVILDVVLALSEAGPLGVILGLVLFAFSIYALITLGHWLF